MQTTACTLAEMIQLVLTQELSVVKGIAGSPDTVELATKVAKEGAKSSAAQIGKNVVSGVERKATPHCEFPC